MTHKTIAQQISSVSTLLMGGLVVMAVIAFAATWTIKSIFIEYRATARSTLEASALFEDIFDARIAALKWRISERAEFVEEFEANFAEISEFVEAVDADTMPQAFVEAVARIETGIAQYGAHFTDMLAAQAIYNELDADLGNLGTATRLQLTEIMETAYADNDQAAAYFAGKTQESLMLGRFYVERFRKTESAEQMNTALSHLEQAQELMAALAPSLQDSQRLALANAARDEMTVYAAKARQLMDTVETRIVSRDALDVIGPRMIADIETALDLIVERQNVIGPRGQSVALYTMVLIVLAAGAVIAVGFIVSRRSAAAIVRDIDQSVDVMSRIAEGDLEVEVRNADQENEIGRMARALEVFQANGKAAIKAAEREKKLEKERIDAAEAHKLEQEKQEIAARDMAEAARKEMIASLSASLGKVVSAASEGDFSKRVEATFTDEELSGLGQAVNTLVTSVDRGLSAMGHVLERVADGDLTHSMDGDFKGAFAQLQDNTNAMIGALKSLVGDISGSSISLASSSAELRDTTDALSKQAEQNAASLEETSAALEELSASIKQVSSNVSDANENARIASETAESSSAVAAAAAEAMNRISGASEEITKVVTVINDISFQINLLALNAGVEAARAGDAGRGFSVVASEVRQLAQRASEAAKEIDLVIARSDHAVSEGVSRVADAQASLAKISESVVGISTRIAEVSSAITEQVHGLSEINAAVSQIDHNTQKQAASFEEVTAASSLLSNEAEGLKMSTARFITGHPATVVAMPAKPARKPVQKMQKVASGGGGQPDEFAGWDEF